MWTYDGEFLIFFVNLYRQSYQFGSWIVRLFFESWASWNNREVAQMK